MKNKTYLFGTIMLAISLTLGACANDNEKKQESMNHESMDHSGSGKVPKNLKAAKNPKYEVGSKAVINADHMKGMKGAKATISGAYNTTAYVVSYTPATGGKKVNNHKWVIQEEIREAGKKALKAGTEVTLNANHMKGMKGATAEIISAENTTVYMVNYKPTTGGKKVTNHKWVTESELSPE
ncbi:YdhK family protein [Fictibacillus barbaricus]|uniref:DUF1541 domain-containing protein n=1 Tax=Fictibacillus barbaricus TaxID=182136 RepID=A0ABU1TV74_9BACL|nr:YdhK family protein [Fictibacillus barbaricus]MDR7071057.1 hypothetical protein [Fictibacillus barbaricus]